MSTPEHRFEVPPEYAEVYERAYRRAYEEGQGQLNGAMTQAPTRRASSRGGKRVAVPEQRSSRRPTPQRTGQRTGQHAGPRAGQRSAPARIPAQRSTKKPTPRVIPPAAPRPSKKVGHRASPRGGSTLYPVLALIVVTALLMVGSFILGRITAGAVSEPRSPQAGTAPGASASASQGPPSSGPAPSESPTAAPTPEVYRGPMAPLRIKSARADCTAPAGRDARNRRVSYAVRNVFDKNPRSAWRCNGRAVGTNLVLRLPRTSEVVLVALVPGAKNRYARHNRITRVAWIFDDGTRVVQTMSGSRKDRSLRKLPIPAVRTRTVTLRILAVARGPKNATMISTVRLDEAAPGAD